MSLLIGQEAEDVQEQIASFAIKNMVERKGNTLRLKEIGPGGKAGLGKVITMGVKETDQTPVLPAEVFSEIKKTLVLSKHRVEQLCQVLRKNKVKMEKNVRQKLHDIDHLLDSEYEKVKVKF